MPNLAFIPQQSHGLYDQKARQLIGIPADYFVKPIVRQNGLGQDMPKGFELPTCMVDPCCVPEPINPIEVVAQAQA